MTPTGVEQTNKNGVLEFTTEQDGTYTILIRDSDIADSGTYDIRFVDLMVKPQCMAGGMLACGVTSTGTISPLDLHMWQFPAKAGDRMILHVLWTGGDLLPVRASAAPGLTTTGVEQTNKNGVLEFTTEQDGTYTILVRDTILRTVAHTLSGSWT